MPGRGRTPRQRPLYLLRSRYHRCSLARSLTGFRPPLTRVEAIGGGGGNSTHTLARHTFLQGAPASQSSSQAPQTQPNPTPRQTFSFSLGNHCNTNTSNTKGLSTLHLTYVSLTPSPETHKHTLRYDRFGFPCFMLFYGVAIGVADITRPLIRVPCVTSQNISTQHNTRHLSLHHRRRNT